MKRLPTRREALRHLAVVSASFAVPGFLVACHKTTCEDVTGLTPDEVKARNETAAYAEYAQDQAKRCGLCAQFLPNASPTACGKCKVLKGPVNPSGGCKLFAAKAV